MVLVSLSKTMRIHGIRTGSICTHANGSCSSLTDDRICTYNPPRAIWRYERADYDRRDIKEKDVIACSLVITLVHDHARTVWQTRDHARRTSEVGKLSLAQITTTRVDHNEPCYLPSDWPSELGQLVEPLFVRWLVSLRQWTGRRPQCARRDGHLLDDISKPGRSRRGDDMGGRCPGMQSILKLPGMGCCASLPIESFEARGDCRSVMIRFHRRLAICLTVVKLSNHFREKLGGIQ